MEKKLATTRLAFVSNAKQNNRGAHASNSTELVKLLPNNSGSMLGGQQKETNVVQSKEELKLRKCEVLTNIRSDPTGRDMDAVWEERPFKELKKGEIFRLYDLYDGNADSTTRAYEDGSSVCVALTDAEPTEPEGNFVVQSLELKGW